MTSTRSMESPRGGSMVGGGGIEGPPDTRAPRRGLDGVGQLGRSGVARGAEPVDRDGGRERVVDVQALALEAASPVQGQRVRQDRGRSGGSANDLRVRS